MWILQKNSTLANQTHAQNKHSLIFDLKCANSHQRERQNNNASTLSNPCKCKKSNSRPCHRLIHISTPNLKVHTDWPGGRRGAPPAGWWPPCRGSTCALRCVDGERGRRFLKGATTDPANAACCTDMRTQAPQSLRRRWSRGRLLALGHDTHNNSLRRSRLFSIPARAAPLLLLFTV